jgi:neuralized-like protein 4
VLLGNEVCRNSTTLKANYCPSLEWLVVGNRVGVRRDGDGNLHFLINGEDMGVAATNLPKVRRLLIVLVCFLTVLGAIVSQFVLCSECMWSWTCTGTLRVWPSPA